MRQMMLTSALLAMTLGSARGADAPLAPSVAAPSVAASSVAASSVAASSVAAPSVAAPANATTASTPTELLARMQARYRAYPTMRLVFRETYTNRATARTLEETGRVFLARPDRVRWEYDGGGKVFLSRDGIGWFHVPEDQVVYRFRMSADESRQLPITLLFGQVDTEERWRAGRATADDPGHLRLDPKLDTEYDYIEARIDPSDARLREVVIVDALGNRTEFALSAEEGPVAIDDALFQFVVPTGVDLVDEVD